jgi:hypothetical protein
MKLIYNTGNNRVKRQPEGKTFTNSSSQKEFIFRVKTKTTNQQ